MQVVDTNKEARDAACREALVLLAEEQAAFEAWRDSLETVPTIKALRTKAEDIRQAEFEKVCSGSKPESGATRVDSLVEPCFFSSRLANRPFLYCGFRICISLSYQIPLESQAPQQPAAFALCGVAAHSLDMSWQQLAVSHHLKTPKLYMPLG